MTDPSVPITPGPAAEPAGAPESPSPQRPRWIIPVVLAAVVALLATGATAIVLSLRPDQPTNVAAQTPASSPSPTAQTATVGQYAGLVNAQATDLREIWADIEECSLDAEMTVFCEIRILSLDLSAQTVVLVLEGAARPGVPAYIGAPPAELERLVADTIEAAQAVDDAIGDDVAGTDVLGLYLIGSRLMDVLDRWEPYI